MMNTIKRLFPKKYCYIAVFSLFIFSQCQNNEVEGYLHEQPTPDVSHIQAKVDVRRFERDLLALDTNNIFEALKPLGVKYPDFLPFFISQVAHDPTRPTMTPAAALEGYMTASQIRRLNDTVQLRFPDLNRYEPDMKKLFQHYKYYFPEHKEPQVITCVTEFVSDAYMVNDTLMLLGLDMFLGEKFIGYDPNVFPAWMRQQFDERNIILKMATVLANHRVPEAKTNVVLDYMIRNGKALYIMDCLLPEMPDSVKMNYTRAQWEGSLANESEIWARLLEMKVMHEPLGPRNQKIVSPGPGSDNVFQEAPGEIGNWIGWRIVLSYMKRYPNTTIKELLAMKDAQQFLEKAKYKPKRVKN